MNTFIFLVLASTQVTEPGNHSTPSGASGSTISHSTTSPTCGTRLRPAEVVLTAASLARFFADAWRAGDPDPPWAAAPPSSSAGTLASPGGGGRCGGGGDTPTQRGDTLTQRRRRRHANAAEHVESRARAAAVALLAMSSCTLSLESVSWGWQDTPFFDSPLGHVFLHLELGIGVVGLAGHALLR